MLSVRIPSLASSFLLFALNGHLWAQNQHADFTKELKAHFDKTKKGLDYASAEFWSENMSGRVQNRRGETKELTDLRLPECKLTIEYAQEQEIEQPLTVVRLNIGFRDGRGGDLTLLASQTAILGDDAFNLLNDNLNYRRIDKRKAGGERASRVWLDKNVNGLSFIVEEPLNIHDKTKQISTLYVQLNDDRSSIEYMKMTRTKLQNDKTLEEAGGELGNLRFVECKGPFKRRIETSLEMFRPGSSRYSPGSRDTLPLTEY